MLVFDDQRKKKGAQKESEVKRFRTFYLEPSIPKKGFRNRRPRRGLSFCFDGQPTQRLARVGERPLGCAGPHGDGAAVDGVKNPEFERVPLWTWL